jgi:hypothetical protein
MRRSLVILAASARSNRRDNPKWAGVAANYRSLLRTMGEPEMAIDAALTRLRTGE